MYHCFYKTTTNCLLSFLLKILQVAEAVSLEQERISMSTAGGLLILKKNLINFFSSPYITYI